MARDDGLDAKAAMAAAETVEGWRAGGKLPFPRLSVDEVARLDGTLDYPPKGSPDAGSDGFKTATVEEHLSAPSDPETGPEALSAGDEKAIIQKT